MTCGMYSYPLFQINLTYLLIVLLWVIDDIPQGRVYPVQRLTIVNRVGIK
jgi:hypothetical protein